MTRRAHRHEEDVVVHSVTTVPAAGDEDADHRMRNYLLMMGVRIVCFVLLVVVHHPIRWAFIVLAVFIPYVAVVIANARAPRRAGEITPVTPPAQHERVLTTGRVTSHQGSHSVH